MNLPNIDLIILTYDRYHEIKKTFEGLCKYLEFDGKINIYIADDSTPDDYYLEALEFDLPSIALKYTRASWVVHTTKTPQNVGWGANANRIMDKCKNDIILFMEDDYVLNHPLDINPYVALLALNKNIGLVRLDGIIGHQLLCHCQETDISEILPHYRQGMGMEGRINYFLIDHASTALNIYSNRVHLKHKRFHDFYGRYIEGEKLGATEDNFAFRVKDAMREDWQHAPALVVPLDATSYFDHIGVSRQHTELDREYKQCLIK